MEWCVGGAAAVGLPIAALLCKTQMTGTTYCLQSRLFRKKVSVHFNNLSCVQEATSFLSIPSARLTLCEVISARAMSPHANLAAVGRAL